MIDIATRDAAIDKVHYRLIDTLFDWMVREKRNIDGFVQNPEAHVDYNPYLIVDYGALVYRSGLLGQVSQGLYTISAYKKGIEPYSRSMHDLALNAIPDIIFQRLYDWMVKRLEDMEIFFENAKITPPVPTKDYIGLASFDEAKYLTELTMYRDGVEGLAIVLEYKRQ